MAKPFPKWKRLSTVACVRYGAAKVEIPTVWLKISHEPSFDLGESESNKYRNVFRMNSSVRLQTGDFLVALIHGFNRVFCVNKIAEAGNSLYAYCHELGNTNPMFASLNNQYNVQSSAIIPDEFIYGLIEEFWKESGTGFVINERDVLTLTPPVGTLASHGSFLHQTLLGDFDVYCQVKSPVGSVSNIWRAFLGVRIDDMGVYSVLKRDGGLHAGRIDQTDGSTQYETNYTVVDETFEHLRIRRQGKLIYTYYGYTTNNQPIEWNLLEPSGVSAASGNEAGVGVGGYLSASAVGVLRFDFVRNWGT